jgi:hypothetical protein
MGKLVWVGQVVVGQCGVDGRAMQGVGASCRVGRGKLGGGKGVQQGDASSGEAEYNACC